jgi:hypothetical protein
MDFLTILIFFALSCHLSGMTLADHKCKAVSNVDKMANKEMFLAMTNALKFNAEQMTNALKVSADALLKVNRDNADILKVNADALKVNAGQMTNALKVNADALLKVNRDNADVLKVNVDALKVNAEQMTNALKVNCGLAMAASGARKTDEASVLAPEKLKSSLVDISEQLPDEEGTAGDDEVSPPIVPQATMTDVLELQGRQQSSTILDETM